MKGSRINVRGPEKRGDSKEFFGWYLLKTPLSLG
jgi:hypothetical protein